MSKNFPGSRLLGNDKNGKVDFCELAKVDKPSN